MEKVATKCCKSKFAPVKSSAAAKGSMSFLSTVLLILLPKCPLCMTAYMSAMVLFFDIPYAELTPILLHAKPVMGLLIIVLILMNRKDKRTWISLGLTLTAMVFLLAKTYYNALVLPDVIIYSAFVFAIWYNGNFRYFYRFIKTKIISKFLNSASPEGLGSNT